MSPTERVPLDPAESRARLEALQVEREELHGQLLSSQRRVEAVKEQAASRKADAQRQRRRVLSSTVLRHLIGVRAAQLRYRASARDADARDRQLRERSAAYRERVAVPDPGPGAFRIELDGLPWWVPVGDGPPDFVERTLRKESLPYRGILQTREVCGGGVMLDLGAHDGSTSIPRVLLGDAETCYCAEPDPLNYACLVANLVQNGLRGFVMPDRIAIGAAGGVARVQRSKMSRGHRVVPPDAAGAADDLEVVVRSMDGWIADLQIDPQAVTFVKSDTQGFEVDVLRGAPALLARRTAAWQIEVAPQLLTLTGSDVRDLVALLQRYFTHFIDLNVGAPGKRVRPIAEAAEGLSYVGSDTTPHTDIVAYAARGAAAP
jgi:FkbM family methyltransferase